MSKVILVEAPPHIFLEEDDLVKFGGQYYNSSTKKQPLRIRQLQHYGDYKILQLQFTKRGYRKVRSYGVVTRHMVLPDQMVIYGAKPQVICEDERLVWYIYKRVRTMTDQEIRKLTIDNILSDLEDI